MSTLDSATLQAPERIASDLPPKARPSRPAFVDAESCNAWLDEVPLVNVSAANATLTSQIQLFAAVSCEPQVRYDVLEVLRPAVLTVQREHAKRFRGKPLPLSPQRRQSLVEVSNLWDALVRGYVQCLEAMPAGDATGQRLFTKMCHRALDAQSLKMRDLHHAYVQVASADFTTLHTLFALAEREDVERNRVRDPARPDAEPMSCERIYVTALMLEAATPREHRPLALGAVERWTDQWSSKITLDRQAPQDAKAPSLAIDLASTGAAHRGYEGLATDTMRFLDMGTLAHSLEKRIHALRKGMKLEELDLGMDLTKRDFEMLLVGLHRQWCSGKMRRAAERHQINSIAHVSVGIQAAHFFLSKRPFEQPIVPSGSADERGVSQGEARIKAATEYMLIAGINAEQWIVRDESVGGLGLIRPSDEAESTRLAHGQLVSVRPRGGNTVTIGTIQWLQEAQDGDLHVGVKLVPGLPNPVAVRIEDQGKFVPALLLPTVTALNAPTSLLLPHGTYTPQREVEIHSHRRERAQLTGLLEVGADFERVAFIPLENGDART